MDTDQNKVYKGLVHKFKTAVKKRQEALKKGEEVGGQDGSMLMDLRKAANHPLLLRNHYDDKLLRKMAKAVAKEETDRNEDYLFEDMQALNDFELYNLCTSGEFKVIE